MAKTAYRVVCAVAMIMMCIAPARSFDLSHYTETSRLASGTWVKVGVPSTGLYVIPTATLRSWGFDDVSKVRIYGYGGNRITEELVPEYYVDDLPQIYSEVTDQGVVFYGVGPDEWVKTTGYNAYHIECNQYSLYGYYFVTSEDGDTPVQDTTGTAGAGENVPTTLAEGRTHYEKELSHPAEAGPLLVGEDFRYKPQQTFTIATPYRTSRNNATSLECQFVAKTIGVPSYLKFTANGEALQEQTSDRISSTSDNSHTYGMVGLTRRTFSCPGDTASVTVGISLSSSGVIYLANLDYLTLTYKINLDLPSTGTLTFWGSERAYSLGNATEDTRIWDVTDVQNALNVNRSIESGRAVWSQSYLGQMRSYVAWKPGAALPTPEYAGIVRSQNLHAPTPEGVDMVIFTTTALKQQAQRIADLHTAADSMIVNVVDVSLLYNEFSSGTPDISALRKYLKMLYDRNAATAHPLKYALLLGRITLDNRYLLATTRALGYETMPAWMVRTARTSLSDNDGYSTDDYIAMLADGSGLKFGLDDLEIAVGRIPMVSAHDGAEIVDKLYQYVNSSKHTGWKNRIMVLADDGDQGIHLRQTERMVANIMSTDRQQHMMTKVYLDAYTKSSGEYPQARADMFQALDDGVAWWFFIGHANNHSWTGDGQFTYTDINNLYLRNLPFLVAATCNFLQWDSETTSGGEILYKERYGGVIAMISACRPVYITDNGYLLESFGRELLRRDENGLLPTAGEMYRRAKNNILNSRGEHESNTNRLRFVFMGDPAMRLSTPSNIVQLLTINGEAVDLDKQLTLAALENATITGQVTDPFGNKLDTFSGSVTVELYDALKSITTHGNNDSSVEVFDTDGTKLFAGSAPVNNGEFTLHISMPSMITDNFREAALSMYATATDNTEAIGVNREFYVYGFKEPEVADTIPPTIEYLVLNHAGFHNNDRVNSAPMVIAEVRDNVGINISTAGIGQQLNIKLDSGEAFSDVSSFYTPLSDGSIGGTINYQIENIPDGAHSVTLCVYDTSGNSARTTIDFYVDDSLAPQIFDVYCDANPAKTTAGFYVKHDRPENIVEVQIEVFDLMGRPIWVGTSKGMSDGDTSVPVTWDLTDTAGRRVNRGIYLYRASITTDNAQYTTQSRRLAVAGE